ncbi:glycosyltransferase family 4 protein [Pseudomonadales bacterium]|nr:glycosyltransferase family 4 protein [Pseudomonadales bacterium]
MKTIIFGNRANIRSIGGVENSIRSMALLASKSSRVVIVCRRLRDGENTVPFMTNGSIEMYEYKEDFFGRNLARAYEKLKQDYPQAIVISRHHLHCLAASKYFSNIKYLVPSVIKNQLSVERTPLFSLRNQSVNFSRVINTIRQNKAFVLSERVYVFSETMHAQVISAGGKNLLDKIDIVKPGVDGERFRVRSPFERKALRENLGVPLEKKIILFVGRLVQAKGLSYLLDAIKSTNDNFVLLLLGQGALESNIRKFITDHNLNDKIFFLGPKGNVEDYYSVSDLFAMTSVYEPLGQTIIEAGASGLPIVAFSRASGVDTATEELGLNDIITYVDELHSTALLEALNAGISKPYDPKEVERLVKTKYSWATLLEKLT